MNNVLHLIDDARPGGVVSNLNGLDKYGSELNSNQSRLLVDPSVRSARQFPDADVIVVHFAIAWRKLPFLLALRAANRSAVLILQEHHYSPEHFAGKTNALRRFLALTMACAKVFDRIVTVSEAQAAWYQSLGIPITAVVPPIADLAALLELPKSSRTAPLTVGVSGRLEHTKGIDLVLQAATLEPDSGHQYLIAGDGSLRDAVEESAKRHAHVHYYGTYEQPRDFLRHCDLVVVPSRLDTFGMAALEAKAAARPICVTRTCGLVDQVQGCGVVVEADCPRALSDGINQLVSRIRQQDLATQARLSATQHNTETLKSWSQQYQTR